MKIKYISDLKSEIQYYYKESHSKRTIEMYSNAIKKYISINSNRALNQITMRSIEEYKIRIAEKTSKTTANINLRTLKAAFNFAKKFGSIHENPCIGIKQFQIPEHQKLCFEPNELKILFENIDDSILRRIVFFALHSGARIGEILNLQWADINYVKKMIHISNKNDFLTKTRRERFIPLFSKLKNIVYEDPYVIHEVNTNRQQIIAFNGVNVIELDHKREKSYVFGKYDGTKFSIGFISKKFKECLRNAGLDEKFHFHCLRHTALTNMANAGVPAFIIKEIAGHSDIKTTQGYVHPSLNDMSNWLEQMDYSVLDFSRL